MTGPRSTAEAVGQALNLYTGAVAVGVELFREKQHINTHSLAFRSISFLVSWVLVQVFFGTKLKWIDEDRYHQLVAVRTSDSHQGEVAFMQEAHGGNKSHPKSCCTPSNALFLKPTWALNGNHGLSKSS